MLVRTKQSPAVIATSISWFILDVCYLLLYFVCFKCVKIYSWSSALSQKFPVRLKNIPNSGCLSAKQESGSNPKTEEKLKKKVS